MARSIHSTVKGSRLLDALDRERLLRGKSCAPPLNSRQDKMPHGGGNITIMAWRSFLIFGDIEGKLDVLCVECTKCARKRRYNVRRLIEKYGRKANMMKWKEQLNGDWRFDYNVNSGRRADRARRAVRKALQNRCRVAFVEDRSKPSMIAI
jgi:hypothetical protein